ncbi:MAG: RtcB family protein [Candidatus Omnitrophica bacterium]|nr:RtcB family protein [Candidatus Omnitrophota bacterium]MDD5488279.1 RtcB family protein [Candidatus Omnitrophota bacterium]
MTGKHGTITLERVDGIRWRIPSSYMPGMKVEGIIYSDEKMMKDIVSDNALQQVANAACLPGIVRASMAMPDIHWGYGLPIGGVIATDIVSDGVVTPGGVGYDINCGVRLLRTSIPAMDLKPRIKELMDALFGYVPAGVGSSGKIRVDLAREQEILLKGAKWAVKRGYGWSEDLEYSEENGAICGADPSKVSTRAFERGKDQPGTLGSGNHFLEVQVVEEIYDTDAARAFGLEKGLVTVMIHTGSRGFGHQVCGDYVERMIRLTNHTGLRLPDRQLACAPVKSTEGEDYLGAMRCAANYAWCNRQILTHLTREVFERVFADSAERLGMHLVYDVAHNIAKIEKHVDNGREKELCVHRKGATRALPPGHVDLPGRYKDTGQPVLIPGDMGRCSFVLSGKEGASETFYSTCHGAGRLMSRTAAKKHTAGRHIAREMEQKGVIVRYVGRDTLHEEVPEAYKDVSDVVDVVTAAGLSGKVAKMRPLGVIKG